MSKKSKRRKNKALRDRPTTILANPDSWSVESKRSYSFYYGCQYKDITYQCRCCKVDCVFTAQDQLYTYEVKKASINQMRALCSDCWSQAHHIRNELRTCEELWAESKPVLQKEGAFLNRWLDLIVQLEKFFPHNVDVARKNMLGGFLSALEGIKTDWAGL